MTDGQHDRSDDGSYGVRPPKWKLAVVTWLGVFPPLLALAYGLKEITDLLGVDPPLWTRLLIETLILVPLLNVAIKPALDSVFEGWLYPDGAPKAPRAGG